MRKRENKSIEILIRLLPVEAFALAVIIGGIIMALSGYNPFIAYGSIIQGAFNGKKAICQTLSQATPLIFSGLAYVMALKVGMINIGVEGQLYIGALGASFFALLPLKIKGQSFLVWGEHMSVLPG